MKLLSEGEAYSFLLECCPISNALLLNTEHRERLDIALAAIGMFGISTVKKRDNFAAMSARAMKLRFVWPRIQAHPNLIPIVAFHHDQFYGFVLFFF